jgi:BolA family transcriptional regulator, general stress-responsive regulator
MTSPTPTRQQRIEQTLRTVFEPLMLIVEDESHQHAGHSGARPGGETHYRVMITSESFTGQTRVAMHRQINALLQNEFDTGLHALAIEARGI